MSEEATLRLVHELEVHQIELEMQNEELLRVLEELKVSRNELNDKAALQEAALAKVAEKERLLSGILDGIQDGICMLDENLRIIRVNPFFEQYYAEKMPFLGQKCHEVFWSSMEPCEHCPSIRTLQSGDRATRIFSDTHGGKKFWFELETFPILNAEKSSVTGVVECVRDITERKRAESRELGRRQELKLIQEELVEKVSQLEAALAKVKQLEGIIPICMYCKKIRDDKESWQQLEGYITEHTDALFSHGICPECYRKAAVEALKEFDNNQH